MGTWSPENRALTLSPAATYAGAVAIRVAIAEDNLLVREGLERLLGLQSDIEVVASCGDLDALYEAVDSMAPDVLVTDIRMPPDQTDEGIRAALELRERQPELGVVVLSQFADPTYALALLEAGSERRAYLLKDRVDDVEQLVGAVRSVAGGGSVVDPKVVEALVSTRGGDSSPLDELTPRELDVMREMAQGKNNAAIAESLVLSERSVEKYVHAIFAKLGIAWEANINRRVKAVLLYLGEQPR
jgi:DNA-binding NarL/FixJ family response regulator